MTEKVLAEIPQQECLVYLDDILVHGSSLQAALGSLQQVLNKIAAAGQKLHLDKCCFMRRELELLGHKVSGVRHTHSRRESAGCEGLADSRQSEGTKKLSRASILLQTIGPWVNLSGRAPVQYAAEKP